MTFVILIFLLVAIVAVVALWRNAWDFRKAWVAIVAFGAAIGGGLIALWNSGVGQ